MQKYTPRQSLPPIFVGKGIKHPVGLLSVIQNNILPHRIHPALLQLPLINLTMQSLSGMTFTIDSGFAIDTNPAFSSSTNTVLWNDIMLGVPPNPASTFMPPTPKTVIRLVDLISRLPQNAELVIVSCTIRV